MRYFFAFAIFAAALCEVSSLRAQEGLFSEVAMESVFSKSDPAPESVATKGAVDKITRITGVSTLVEALRAAGLEPEEADGLAKFKLEQAGWKFPVSLRVDVDQDRIACEMSLIVISDSTAATDTLLELLSLGDSVSGAFFAYDRDRNLIQLRSSFSNRSVTAGELKADLDRLASLAEQHSKVWSKLKTSSRTAKSPAKSGPKSLPKKFSLVGRWSASLSSGESFAIQITSSSKFQLVHLKSGKSTISKGSVTRAGDRLTLVGDDSVTLKCRVSQTNAEKFQLAILDAKDKTSVKLDFKKAK